MANRKRLRLPSYDYSCAGGYFVTVCLSPRRPLLGRVADDTVELSALGRIVWDDLLAIPARREGISMDCWAVMPDHVHAIVFLHDRARHASPLRVAIGSFKAGSARDVNRARGTPGAPLWQRGYFDHVIRDDDDLDRVRRYIVENPLRWTVSRTQAALARRGPGTPGPYADPSP